MYVCVCVIVDFVNAGIAEHEIYHAFFRSPLLMIKTNSYHFCKLSLVKEPNACSTRGSEPKDDHDSEAREADGLGNLDGKGWFRENSDDCSNNVQGLLR